MFSAWVPPSRKASADECSEVRSECLLFRGSVEVFLRLARQSFMRRRVFLGCLVWVDVCSEGSYSEVRVIAVFTDKVNIYFLLFWEAANHE